MARALQLLGDGLSQLGIGAKTALGYGVMGLSSGEGDTNFISVSSCIEPSRSAMTKPCPLP